MPLRPCIDCQRIGNWSRCPEHDQGSSTARYGRGWDALARRVIAEETGCWRCGSAELAPDDKWTAGHVVDRRHGGRSVRENLRKEHRSCNSAHSRR